MWSLPDLTARSSAPELMDDLSIGGQELKQALHQLRWINRLLGASWPILEGVIRLWRGAGRPTRLTILDVGAGSGDVNRLLLRWAAWRGIEIELTLMDIQPDTCAAAADYYRDKPAVRVVQGDVFGLAARQADIITASLFVHHFPSDRLPAVLRTMLQGSRRGVVVNDLQRHWLAWASIRAATRLLSRNRMIRHDAPLSVRRGFQATDLDRLRMAPGLAGLRYFWRPLFRYLIIIPREERVNE